MPEKGDNAVYKAARVIGELSRLDLGAGGDFPAGKPTLNVGWMRGGMNINSVPDEARFGLDIRLVPGITDTDVMARLEAIAGGDVSFTRISHAASVYTDPAEPWVQSVFALMHEIAGTSTEPAIATYFTDAAALTAAYGFPPTLILGPGDAAMAHQTDEYCLVSRIEEAHAAFTRIAQEWCGV
jgi:succinyl-diaminopimelate desuccinylase